MNRKDFQAIARIRLEEARLLLSSGLYDGAYYLSGYVIECALKACIARKTRTHDFPDRRTVNDSYTHDLATLVRVAGLQGELESEMKVGPAFAVNWGTVKDWNEESRYVAWSQREAQGLYSAIVDRRHGVLRWLRRHW